MQTNQTAVFWDRDDTFFGVCEAIGEDFGFNANYLRIALAVVLYFSPLAALGVYAVAGLVVAGTRWLVPNPNAPEAEANAEESTDEVVDQAQAWEELAVAA